MKTRESFMPVRRMFTLVLAFLMMIGAMPFGAIAVTVGQVAEGGTTFVTPISDVTKQTLDGEIAVHTFNDLSTYLKKTERVQRRHMRHTLPWMWGLRSITATMTA